MPELFTLYGLRQIGEGIRYVGITSRSLAKRLINHLYAKSRDHRGFWIEKVKRERRVLEIVPLCIGLSKNDACSLEIEVLRELRLAGWPLVNTSLGGSATRLGMSPSLEARRKQSAKLRGRKLSQEHILKSAAARKGKRRTELQVLKNSMGHFGRKTRRNTSGFVGVTWDKQTNKWLAAFMWNKKTFNCGRFENIQDAVEARENAVKERIGNVGSL